MASESDNVRVVPMWCAVCQDYVQMRGQETADGGAKFVTILPIEFKKHRQEAGHS